VDLINTNAYSVSSSATMIEMTFEDYAHNQGVDDITLTNLIGNGDFSNGTTGWGVANATQSVSCDINTVVSNGSTNNVQLWRRSISNVPIGSKYYAVSKVRTTTSGVNTLNLQIEYVISPFTIATVTNPVQNTWYILSNVFTTTILANMLYNNRNYFTTLGAISGVTFEYDFAYLINISTLISNKQYSPLYQTTFDLMSDAQIKAQLDDLIAYYGYFDDEQTFFYINHTDFDTIYTEFFGTAPTVFLDNFDKLLILI